MLRLSACIASTLVVSLWSVSVFAQQSNPSGRSQVQPPTTNQNDPNQAIFGNINQTAWFMEPNIRAQLQINADQANRLNQAYTQFWNVYNRNLPQVTAGSTLTPQQQQAAIDAGNRFYLDFNRSTKDMLSPSQAARFNQLGFQYRGYNIFWDPVYTERFRLTNDQTTRIRKLEQDYNRQLRMAMRDRETYPRRFSELRTEMNERINSVLTDEQRKIWKEYYGEPYTFKVQ